MLTERDRQGTAKATPALALIEITFTPTADGATVAEVRLPGLSAEDAAFYPQLLERYLDRTAAAFADAEPGALPGSRIRDLTSDASLRPARSTPRNPPPRSGAETRQAKTHDVAEIGLSLVINGGIRLVAGTAWTRSSLSRKQWQSRDPRTSAAALASSRVMPATPR
jgi:hypothetical protein